MEDILGIPPERDTSLEFMVKVQDIEERAKRLGYITERQAWVLKSAGRPIPLWIKIIDKPRKKKHG